MRKILSIIMLMMLALNVSAENFNTLWKGYEKAVIADQPKSAIAALHKIQTTAEKKKSYGDLLKALILEQSQWQEISVDSVKSYKARLLAWQKAKANPTNGKASGTDAANNRILATLLQTVLHSEQGAPKVDSLLASPDAGIYTKPDGGLTYKPFIEQGIDSKYFNNDLLSIIAMHTDQEEALQHYYASTSNRTGACIAGALSLMNRRYDTDISKEADSLIAIYGDLPECGAIAVRKALLMARDRDSKGKTMAWIDEALQRWPSWKEMNTLLNMRAGYTQPTCSLEGSSSVINTDTEAKLYLNRCHNIKSMTVTLRHFDANGKEDLQRSFEHALPWKNEYDSFTDTISLGRLPLGVWTVNLTNAEGANLSEEIELHVTNLKVLAIGLPKKQVRYVVVNDITGQPVPGATIMLQESQDLCFNTKKRAAPIRTFTTNSKGEYIYTYESIKQACLKVTTAEDYAMPESSIFNAYDDATKPTPLQKNVNIYTDRAIYRPGQTVHIAIIGSQTKNEKETAALRNEKYAIAVRDASHEMKQEIVVVTDDFGTATADYTIPTDARCGRWTLRAGNGWYGFNVEEYKRPKFLVTINKPSFSYKAGDTITVRGTAKTYSGMSVANAKVIYKVTRNRAWWWYRNTDGQGTLLNDTVYTDANGTFSMLMPMLMPSGCNMHLPLFYSITATATVTDNNGESHTEELSMPLSNREAYLSFDMPERVLADTAIAVTFRRVNAAGKEIDGTVKVTVDGAPQADGNANLRYMLAKNIASGTHTIVGICEGDTVKSDFVAFRKSDTTPMTYTHKWDYVSAQEWKDDNDEVWMQIGSSDKDVHVVYEILANDSVIEQGDTTLNCSVITRTFKYKPEYGDGIEILYAWVKDGQKYQSVATFSHALPEKKLKLEWSTFRNKLVPGQKEQWSVRIKNPDGSPAKAQMMAVLYDKSLEQLAKMSWTFRDNRHNYLCSSSWNTMRADGIYRVLFKETKRLDVTVMDFSRIVDYSHHVFDCVETFSQPMRLRGSKNTLLYSAAKLAPQMTMAVGAANVESADMQTDEPIGSIGGLTSPDEMDEPTTVRSDFSETAFWLPQVIADSKGVAELRFTMPESVTTWNFKAFAHDKEMRYGFLDDEAVTQKQLMIEPNMPRFLRINDKATISANVGNLSEKKQDIKVTMTVLDPSTEKPLYNIYNNVRVEAGKSTSVTFPLDVKVILGKDAAALTDTAFIVKFVAKGTNFSDGEQHLLPVLTDKKAPIDTTAFIVDPKKMIEEALPQLSVPTSNNAITLSNAYYANVMAAHLNHNADVSPANDNVLAQLINLQKADGGFAWYSGMESSKYMTVAVLKTLARVNFICGVQNNTEFMMSKAFAYVEKEMEKEMKYQKEHKVQYLSGTALDWLYALTLTGKDGGSAEKYFRKMLYDETRKDDMQSKAVAGIVMNNNHQTKKAQEFAEAIKQHTVYRADMGRYFDSYRAEYSWCDYKIPTQSMCIEALNDITPQDTTTITEMQKWLVQSKRTQRWDNAINAVNAIYALSLSSAQKSFMARYTANPEDYKDCIKVTREIIPTAKVSTHSSNLQHVADCKVGDKVTVRLTIEADRDYDFVTVTDNRAACLEPTQQLSGYHWCHGGGYYQETRDQKAVYHFDQFRKGTHVIETEYYIDRKGSYNSGKATAICEYAPEFRGTTQEYNIEIK